MPLWPHQAAAISSLSTAIRPKARICVTSPTGGGKSKIMSAIIEQAVERRQRVLLLTHRKLLLTQLSRGLEQAGIEHGIRAAEHE